MPIARLLLLLTLQNAPHATPAPKPAATPDATPFRSEALHLSYIVPSGLRTESAVADQAIKEEQANSTGVQKAAAQCISLPLLAVDTSETFRMVGIMRMDGACLGVPTTAIPLGPIASSALTESLHRFGEGKVLTAVDYKLGDRAASVIRGSVASDKLGTTMYAAVSCVLLDKDIACWEFLATDPAIIDQMAASPVHFYGHEAIPVVPADTIARTK
jgi:hypothetical protein